MICRGFSVFILLCGTDLFFCQGLAAAQSSGPEQGAVSGPVCLYESRAYSDGAFICLQKSLMLNCSSDGTRATWKVVVDRDLSERCLAPTVASGSPAPRRHARRTHAIRHWLEPPRQAPGKCFSFNGKQYCE